MAYETKEASREEELGIAFNVPPGTMTDTGGDYPEGQGPKLPPPPMPGTPGFQDLTTTQKADVLLAIDAAAKSQGTSPGVTVKTSDDRVTGTYTYKVTPTMGPPIPPDLLKKIKEDSTQDPIQKLIAYQKDPLAKLSKEVGSKSYATMSPAEREVANEQYKQTVANFALDMLPIIGTKRYYDEAAKDGMTPDEWAWVAGQAALDVLTIIPAAGIVTGAARGAKGLGTGAKLAAVGSGIKQAAIAEVSAPFTALQHPIETTKSAIRPIRSTIGSLKGVPTSALETRVTTVRAPLDLFDNPEQAKALRDAAVTSRMTGGAGEATQVGKTLKVAGTAANAPGEAVAFHATPDVRPYANGAIIKEGREGGLFLSPNLNTRFADASAFGDLPEGGIPGGLLIRDPEILAKTVPSGKVYAGTVEMEKVIPAGTKLPAPSQYLFTYSTTTGKKLQIAVIGKPYTAAEIAKLKIYGSVDAIKNVLRDPVKVKGANKLKALDDEWRDLGKQIDDHRRRGDPTGPLERRRAALERQYARYAESLNRSRVPVSRLYVVTGKTALERFTDITRRADGRAASRTTNITIPRRAPTADELRRATRAADDARRAMVETPRRAPADDTRRTPANDDRRTPPADDRRTPPADDRRTPPRDDRTPPTRTPTRTPPGTPPPVPPPPRGGAGGAGRVPPKSKKVTVTSKDPTPEQMGASTSWPQGFGWWVKWSTPDGRQFAKFYRGQNPPKGVKQVRQGPGEAYRGIQQFKGGADFESEFQMGAVKVTIDKPKITPGEKGAISFTAREPLSRGRTSRITPKRPRIGR